MSRHINLNPHPPEAIEITGRRGLFLEVRVGGKTITAARQAAGSFAFYIDGEPEEASKTWNGAVSRLMGYLSE